MTDYTNSPLMKADFIDRALAGDSLAGALSSGTSLIEQLALSSREGNTLTEEGLGADLINMSFGELVVKYGEEVASQRKNIQAELANQRATQTADRSVGQVVGDTGLAVGAGFVGVVGGVEAATFGAAGAVDQYFDEENTGFSEMAVGVSKATEDVTGFIRGLQSDELQARQNLSNVEAQLDAADSLAKYEEQIANGGNSFVAGAARIGRDVLNSGERVFSDGAVAGDIIAQGLGSLGPSAKLAQTGIAVVRGGTTQVTANQTALRVSETLGSAAGIGVAEASGTYMDTANAVMSRSIDEMIQSEQYMDLTNGGMDPLEAQRIVAADTAMEAFNRQLPTAAAIGLIAARFNASPMTAFEGKSMLAGLREIGLQTLEEGAQGGTAQFNQNLAIRDNIDPNQSLVEGIGDQIATGAIAGAGMTAGIAGVTGAINTIPNVGKITKNTLSNAADIVTSAPVQAGTSAVVSTVGVSLEKLNLSGALDVIRNAAGPVIDRVQDIAQSSNLGVQVRNAATAKAAQIIASDFVASDTSKALTEAIKAVAVHVKESTIPQAFAATVSAKGTALENVAGVMQAFAQPNMNLSRLPDAAVLFAASNFETLKAAANGLPDKIKAEVAKIVSSKDFKDITDLAAKIDLNKVYDSKTEITPEVQAASKYMAETNPANGNPEVIKKILEQPSGALTAEEGKFFKVSSKIAAAVNGHAGEQIQISKKNRGILSQKPAFKTNPKRLDQLHPEVNAETVSRSVQVDGFNGKNSVNDFAADVIKAIRHPNGTVVIDGVDVKVSEVVQRFSNFAEHMSNKVAALRESTRIFKETGKHVAVGFRSLSIRTGKMVDVGQAGNAKPMTYRESDKAVVAFAGIENDAKVTAEVFNILAQEFSEHFPNGVLEVPSLTQENQTNETDVSPETATTTEADVENKTDPETKSEESVPELPETGQENTTAVEEQEDASEAPAEEATVETNTDADQTEIQEALEDTSEFEHLSEKFNDTFQSADTSVEYADGASLIEKVENSEYARIAKVMLRSLSVRMNARLNSVRFDKNHSVAEAMQSETLAPDTIRDYKNTLFVDTKTMKYDPKLLSLAIVAMVDWMSSARATDPAQLKETLESLGVDYSDLSEGDIAAILYGISPRQIAESVGRDIIKIWNLSTDIDAPMIDGRGAVESLVKELLTVMADTGVIDILDIPFNKDGTSGHTQTINVRNLSKMHAKIGLDAQNSIQKLLAPENSSTPSIGEKLTVTDQTQSRGNVKLSTLEKAALKAIQDTAHYVSEGMSSFVSSLGFDALNQMLGYRDPEQWGKDHPLRASVEGKNLSIERDFIEAMSVVDAIEAHNSDEQVPVYYPVGISKVGRHQFKGINPQNNKILRALVTPTHSLLNMNDKVDADAFWLTVAQSSDMFKVENQSHKKILSEIQGKFETKYSEALSVAGDWLKGGTLNSAAFAEAMGPADMAQIGAVMAVAHLTHAKANGTQGKFNTTLSFELDGKTDGPANMMVNFGQGEISELDMGNFQRVGYFLGRKAGTLNSYFTSADGQSGDLYEVTSVQSEAELINRISKAKPGDKAKLIAVANFSATFNDLEIIDGHYKMTRKTSKSPMTKTVYGSGVKGVAEGIAQDTLMEFYERMLEVPAGKTAAEHFGYVTLAQDYELLFGEKFVENTDWSTTFFDKDSTQQFDKLVEKGLGDILSSTAKNVIGAPITHVNDTLIFLTGVQTQFLKALFERKLAELVELRASQGKLRRSTNGLGITAELSSRDYNALVKELRAYAPSYSNGSQTLEVGSFGDHISDIVSMSSTMDGKLTMKSNMQSPAIAGVKVIPYLSIGRGDAMMMNIIYGAENAPTDTLPVFDGIDMPIHRIRDYASQINESVAQNWDRDVLVDVVNDFQTFLSSVGSETDLLEQAFATTVETSKNTTVIVKNSADLLTSLKELHRQNQARKAVFKRIPASIDHQGGSDTSFSRGPDGNMDRHEINGMIRDELNGVPAKEVEVDDTDIGVEGPIEPKAEDGKFSKLSVTGAQTMVDAVVSETKDKNLIRTLKAIQSMIPVDAKIVTGSLTQLQAYRAENFDNDGQVLTDAKGMYDVANNVIFLSENNHETIAHELVHMTTFSQVLTHYEGQSNPAVERLESLMSEFMGLDLSKASAAVQEAANQAMGSILQNQTTDTALAKASALNEFMAWSLSNAALSSKLGETSVIARMGKKVIALMKRILGNVPTDMFSSVLFNARVLNQPADPVGGNSGDGNNNDGGEVTPMASRFTNFWLKVVRERLDQSGVADGKFKRDQLIDYVSTANGILSQLDQGGFNLSEYQKQTFMAIHSVIATEMRLDTRSLMAVSKLFEHVTSNLAPSMFGPINPQERFSTVMELFGATKNDEGVSDSIAILLALSQTSNGFREALNRLPQPDSEGTLIDGSLNSVLEALTGKLMRKVLNTIDISGESATDILDNLSEELLRQDDAKEYSLLKGLMSSISKADAITNGAMSKLAERTSRFDDKVKASNRADLTKIVVSSVAVATSFLDEKRSKDSLKGLKNASHMGVALDHLVPVREFFSEVTGTDAINKDVVAQLDIVNFNAQSVRQAYREDLPGILSEAFETAPTPAQWKMMHGVLGKTDFAQIFNLKDPDSSIRLLVSDSRLAKKVATLEKAITANFNKQATTSILEKTQQLAEFMNGNGAGHQLWANAYAINKFSGDFQEAMTSEIDQLVSFYALQGRDAAEKKTVVDLYNSDPEGVHNLLVYMQGLNKVEDEKIVSEEAKLNGYKGFIPDQGTGGSRLIIEDDANEASLLARGFVRIANYTAETSFSTISRGYYATTVKQGGLYSQGVLQSVQSSYRGVDAITGLTSNGTTSGVISGDSVATITDALNKAGFVEDQKEALIPRYDANGDILFYERMLNPDLVADYLAPKSNLALMLGAWAGRQVEEQFAKVYNVQLIEKLKEIYDNRDLGSDALYIDMSRIDQSKGDKIYADTWRVISPETKAIIEDVFSEEEGFMVRKDMINLALGYREASITDMWSGKTRMPEAVKITVKATAKLLLGNRAVAILTKGADPLSILSQGEEALQGVVSTAKDLIVVRSLIVPFMNAQANMLQLSTRGVPIKATIQGTRDKLIEIEQYNENVTKIIRLEAQIQLAGTDANKVAILQQQRQAIWDLNARMSIAPLNTAGAYKNISEGITNMDVEITSGRVGDWIEAKLDKLPGGFRTAVKYGLLSKDTAIYKAANKSVQYGDFIAKSIYYDHIFGQGLTHEQAMEKVNEEFVNFSVLPGRMRSALESNGFSWFMTFKIRIMKVALSMMQNNPVRSLITGGLLPEVGSPIGDNLVSVVAEDRLDYSLGPDMLLGSPELNPWINLIDWAE